MKYRHTALSGVGPAGSSAVGKDIGNDNQNKRMRANSTSKDEAPPIKSRGRRGGVRQRERDERKRERADSRDSRDSRDGVGAANGAGGRNSKRAGGEGGGSRMGDRGSGKDAFAGGAGGPSFKDLENWDPEKVG